MQVGTGYIALVALIPRQCGQKRRQRASLQKGFRDRGLNKISPRRCLRTNLSSRPPACPNQISKSKYKQLAQFRLHIYIKPAKRRKEETFRRHQQAPIALRNDCRCCRQMTNYVGLRNVSGLAISAVLNKKFERERE